MNFLDENMKLLKQKYLYIYEMMEIKSDETKESSEFDIENIKLLQTAAGEKTIEVTKQNEIIRLNSMFNIAYETEKWVEGFDFNSISNVFIVFGMGNGAYIKKLLDKVRAEDIIIVYEPSEQLFRFSIENFDFTNILLKDKLQIFIGEHNNKKMRDFLFSCIYLNNIKNQCIIMLPQYNRLFYRKMIDFIDIIKDNNKRVMMIERTNAYFGKVVVSNILNNLKYLPQCSTVGEYEGLFPTNVPAIIVAAGPSLDKNIEQLRLAKGKSVIFCVDRALEYLYKRGIEPDYAVTIDPIKPTNLFAAGYNVKVPLITSLQSHCEVLDLHKGSKIFFDSGVFIENVLVNIKKPIIKKYNTGLSVATAAFAIAMQMNFSTIILVGQDLAYASDGRVSHAGGVVQSEPSKDGIWVEGINEEKVKSREDWYEFLMWFEKMTKIAKEAGKEIIDATEGGAKIKGTTIMKLADAINAYCKDNINIAQLESKMKPVYTRKDLIRIEKYFDKGIKELSQIKKKAEVASELCNKMIKKCKRKTSYDLTAKKINERILKANEDMALKSIYPLMDCYITDKSADIKKDVFQITNDKDKDLEDSYKYSKATYELIREAADEIKIAIDSNFKRWTSEENKK